MRDRCQTLAFENLLRIGDTLAPAVPNPCKSAPRLFGAPEELAD